MLRVSCVIRSTEIHPVFFGLLPTSFFSSNQSMLLAIFGAQSEKFFLRISNLQSDTSSLTLHTSSHSRKQSAFGGYNMSTGVKAHVAGSCGCKAGWFEMFPRLCKVDRGCAAAWQVGFRWLSSRRAGKIDDAISKKGKKKTFELEYI